MTLERKSAVNFKDPILYCTSNSSEPSFTFFEDFGTDKKDFLKLDCKPLESVSMYMITSQEHMLFKACKNNG